MISVMCEKCIDNWFVSDDIWKKVKYCPFCGEKVKVSYGVKEDSFEGLLKNIVFNQGLSILKEKRKLVSLLMDIGSNYQKEIKVFSNFCTEDILEKFYEYREERQKLEREAEIAKYDLIDSGISEKWADMMIGSLVRIITDKEPEAVLPMNFRTVDSKDIMSIVGVNFQIKMMEMDENLDDAKIRERKGNTVIPCLVKDEICGKNLDYFSDYYVITLIDDAEREISETFLGRNDFDMFFFDREKVFVSNTIIKCNNCKMLYVSPNCKGIDKNAVCDCENLKYIYIDSKNAYIDKNAFSNCPQITVICGKNTGNIRDFCRENKYNLNYS